MRALFLIPLLMAASPVLAQVAAPPPPPLPPQMMDPALPAQLGRMAGALAHVFLNLPVGDLQAAVEGRPATPSDHRRTVGSEAGPYVAQNIQRDVVSATGTVQSSARAMQRALPAVQQALGQVAAAIERETANMPSPGYPRR